LIQRKNIIAYDFMKVMKDSFSSKIVWFRMNQVYLTAIIKLGFGFD